MFKTIFTISGEPSQVKAVETLITEVGKRVEVLDNELGMYIPFQSVMRVIVGENDYEGNIIFMEHTADGALLLKCEEEHTTLYAFDDAVKEFFGVKTDFYDWEEQSLS